MPAYFSPIGNEPQTDANGDPIVGGKIWTYQAGTSTPAVTYTGSDGLTPQANPIILNSSGLPASPIWLQGGLAYKFVFTDANDVQTRPTVDNITGINDPAVSATLDEWALFTGAPSYVNATSFTLGGDQTNIFQINRRVKTTNTGGTVYSTVTNSAFGGGATTVTLLNDSGSLDVGLSQVSFGLISASNTSAPMIRPTLMSAVAASGVSLDFLAIPAWVRKITLSFYDVSNTGGGAIIAQLGSSGGVEITGYASLGVVLTSAPAMLPTSFTNGFGFPNLSSSNSLSGNLVLTNFGGGGSWSASGMVCAPSNSSAQLCAGAKTLSGTLDRVRVANASGTFDGGSIGLMYE